MFAANIAAHWVQSGMVTAAVAFGDAVAAAAGPGSQTGRAAVDDDCDRSAVAADAAVKRLRTAAAAGDLMATFNVCPPSISPRSNQVAPRRERGRIRRSTRRLVSNVVAGVGLRVLWLTVRRHPARPVQPAARRKSCAGAAPRARSGNRQCRRVTFCRPAAAAHGHSDGPADRRAAGPVRCARPAFQRAVICHELLHIKRRDITRGAFVEELAVAVLWFHPWVWLLRARIRVGARAGRRRRVVAMLGDRDEYVRCLVDISGHDLAPHFSQAGAGHAASSRAARAGRRHVSGGSYVEQTSRCRNVRPDDGCRNDGLRRRSDIADAVTGNRRWCTVDRRTSDSSPAAARSSTFRPGSSRSRRLPIRWPDRRRPARPRPRD